MVRGVLLVMIMAAVVAPAAALAQSPAPDPTPPPFNRGHNPGDLAESLRFGLELGVIGVGAVFLGLLAVYGFMVGLRNLLERRRRRAEAKPSPGTAPILRPQDISSEVAHAIALALFMDLRTFDDDEAEEVTIKKLTRPFSPWMDSWKTALMLSNQRMFRKQ